MIEVRTKDKLFLVVVIPLAVLATYWFGWRTDAVRRLGELEHRHETLVSEDDFEVEMSKARRELAAAQEELAAEGNVPIPEAQVKSESGRSQAERERGVLSVLRSSGLFVSSVLPGEVETVRTDGGRTLVGGDFLRAAGVCDQPVLRIFSVDGDYAQVMTALRAFERQKMAVVPEQVERTAGMRGKWKLSIWL